MTVREADMKDNERRATSREVVELTGAMPALAGLENLQAGDRARVDQLQALARQVFEDFLGVDIDDGVRASLATLHYVEELGAALEGRVPPERALPFALREWRLALVGLFENAEREAGEAGLL
jgi:hypothetical protein